MKIYGIRRFEFAGNPFYDVGTALLELDPPITYDKCGIEYFGKNSWLINRVLKTNFKSRDIFAFGKSYTLQAPEFDKKNNDKHFIWRWKYPNSDWISQIQINENDVVSFESDDDALLWYETVKDRVEGARL